MLSLANADSHDTTWLCAIGRANSQAERLPLKFTAFLCKDEQLRPWLVQSLSLQGWSSACCDCSALSATVRRPQSVYNVRRFASHPMHTKPGTP